MKKTIKKKVVKVARASASPICCEHAKNMTKLEEINMIRENNNISWTTTIEDAISMMKDDISKKENKYENRLQDLGEIEKDIEEETGELNKLKAKLKEGKENIKNSSETGTVGAKSLERENEEKEKHLAKIKSEYTKLKKHIENSEDSKHFLCVKEGIKILEHLKKESRMLTFEEFTQFETKHQRQIGIIEKLKNYFSNK